MPKPDASAQAQSQEVPNPDASAQAQSQEVPNPDASAQAQSQEVPNPDASAQPKVQVEQKFTIDITGNQNWVDGPGAAGSSLSQDAHLNSDFGYNYQRIDGDNKFQFGFQGRYTDDRTTDPQTWSLTNLSLNWEDKYKKLSVGDVMADFSSYSLSGAVKGADFNFKTGGDGSGGDGGPIGRPEINAVYGVSYPRWDNFWGGEDLKAINRMVGGVNVRESPSDRVDLGLSFVRTDDSNRLSDWDQLFRNTVYSFNWEARPWDSLTFKGESAFSQTSESPSESDPDRLYQGYAHLFTLNQESKRNKWSYEYERVSPQFTSLLGSALTDQERMKLKWTGKLNPDLNLTAGVGYSYNDLPDSTQFFRTELLQPELTFSFNEPFKRDNATLDLGIRLDCRNGGEINSADSSASVQYHDTFGKVDADMSLEYQFSDTSPHDSGSQSDNLMYNITLGTDFTQEKYVLKPTLNLSFTRNMDFLNHYNDRMLDLSLGLSYQRQPANFSLNCKIGQNQNLKESSPDSRKWFGTLRVEGLPGFLKKLSPNAKLFLEINVNAYEFDAAGDNYRETGAVLGAHMEF